MTEDPELALKETLLAIGRGEQSLAQVLGLSPERLRRVGEHAAGLIRAGQAEAGEALLTNLAQVDLAAPVPVMLLAFSRATRGDHRAAVPAYGEAIARSERLGSAVLTQKAVFGRAQSWLALGAQPQGHADLLKAATGPDASVGTAARAYLEQISCEGEG